MFTADFSYFGGAESLSEGRSPRRTVLNSPTAHDNGKLHPGPPQDPSDFLWLMTEEPHRSRRLAILKAHPEVRRRNQRSNNSLSAQGNKTHGIRTFNKMARSVCCCPPTHCRNLFAAHPTHISPIPV
jgi:hypothetical protein